MDRAKLVGLLWRVSLFVPLHAGENRLLLSVADIGSNV
jgi:hypothetical protein